MLQLFPITQYLENTGEVPEIEDIMEFDGRGKEHLGHFVMQCK
jgi:hypothetical protein